LQNVVHLVASDLDGSLLDHQDYTYEAAKPVLQLLEEMRIPLVLASSKTRAEMLELRAELGNEHPFISEGGAAVWIPEQYFTRPPADTVSRDGYRVREFAPPREHWIAALNELRRRLPDQFLDFASAGTEGIVAMTGLTAVQADRANQRDYSEPVQWRGDEEGLAIFLRELQRAGASVARGGRFYSIAGDCDKGQAWNWLREQYARAAGMSAVRDLTIGDAGNDVPMLEIAEHALLIPAQGRPLPELNRSDGIIVGEGYGPEAWAFGVREWLREMYRANEE
jgi:mannosyl-3-phosphoglycerate phosphatase